MALLWRSFVRRRVISLATSLAVMATSFALAQDPTAALAQDSTSAQRPRAAVAQGTDEQLFLLDNDLAMSKMSRDMMVEPTGDVDRDFVAMMIPHHQGAIDMAQAELKYGHNPELRALAQNIVTQQQQEISAMRRAVGQASPTEPGEAAAPQSSAGSNPSKPPAAMNPMKMN